MLRLLVRREAVAEGLAMSREDGVAAALRTATATAIVLRAMEQARETLTNVYGTLNFIDMAS